MTLVARERLDVGAASFAHSRTEREQCCPRWRYERRLRAAFVFQGLADSCSSSASRKRLLQPQQAQP